MLVYRVDYPYRSVNLTDSPNNTVGKPAMTIVPADGKLITSYNIDGTNVTKTDYTNSLAADPYPGTGNVTDLESVTLNATTLTNAPLYSITEDTNSEKIGFAFKDRTLTAIHTPAVTTPSNDRIYTLDGRIAGTLRDRLPKGIYVWNGKKIVVR